MTQNGGYSRGVTLWAMAGVAAMFVEAIVRLATLALETIQRGLTPLEWVCWAVVVAFFTYAEGYRALHRRFAPQVLERVMQAAARPVKPSVAILAPFYALTLFGAPRGALVRAWLSVVLIIGAVFAVRALPFPARGIVDAGVTMALSWGLCALLYKFYVAVRAPSQVRDAQAAAEA